ncbi:MAG: response regulator [Peptostreptococcus sp.]|uniref:LytR/AlgR family response regulator transcription factor n=1 Tax=Peptostreptococcus sp. TaxID=1262 RepID=UPI002FC78992
MIKAIICEDDYDFSKKVKKSIESYFRDENIEVTINIANSAKSLIENAEELEYNIFFFDIEIGKDDGIELANYIREGNKNAIFIFITNKNDRVYEVFSLDTFGFVRKDHFNIDFPLIMDRLMKSISQYTYRYLINTKNKEYKLTINDIKYIERVAGVIVIHRDSEQITTSYRYFTELPFNIEKNKNFGEVYRGVFVNYKYLENIDIDFVLLDNEKRLPLSRRKRKVIKEEYKNYILEK